MRMPLVAGVVFVVALGWPMPATADEAATPPAERPAAVRSTPALSPPALRAIPPLERTRGALLATVAVRRRANDSLKNGTIIGAVAGTGYGVAVSLLLRGELDTHGMIAGTVTCAAMGAGIGAL